LATFVRSWPLWLLLVCVLVQGQGLPTPPYASVIDHAQVLQPQDVASLVEELSAIRGHTGASVAVLIEDSTLPEGIDEFANRVANDWKLGGKVNGVGVLIVVAVRDRAARIEVSRALEGALPDLYGKRILKETMSPQFAKGEYHLGLLQGIRRIASIVQLEVTPKQARPTSENRVGTPVQAALIGTLFVSIFLAFWLTFALVFRWGSTYLCGAVGSILGALEFAAASAVGPGIGWGSGVAMAAMGIVLPWWFVRRYSPDNGPEMSARQTKKEGKRISADAGSSTAVVSTSSGDDDNHTDELSSRSDSSNSSGGGGDFAGGGASDKW
jgi:uncharacterized protein